MRWLLGLAGAGVLIAAMVWALPKLRRPELNIELHARPGNAEDAAFHDGLRRALDERDGFAGRYRVRLPPFAPARGHILFPGRDVKDLPPAAGWIAASWPDEALTIAEDLEARGLKRLALPYVYRRRRAPETVGEGLLQYFGLTPLGGSPKGPPERIIDTLLQDAPHAVFLERPHLLPVDIVARLRERGFSGPIYVAGRDLGPGGTPLSSLEGALVALCPLKTPPGGGHPFTYAAYEGARAFFELLDEREGDNPVDVAKELQGTSIFDALRGPPRLLEIRGGRLEPSK